MIKYQTKMKYHVYLIIRQTSFTQKRLKTTFSKSVFRFIFQHLNFKEGSPTKRNHPSKSKYF